MSGAIGIELLSCSRNLIPALPYELALRFRTGFDPRPNKLGDLRPRRLFGLVFDVARLGLDCMVIITAPVIIIMLVTTTMLLRGVFLVAGELGLHRLGRGFGIVGILAAT